MTQEPDLRPSTSQRNDPSEALRCPLTAEENFDPIGRHRELGLHTQQSFGSSSKPELPHEGHARAGGDDDGTRAKSSILACCHLYVQVHSVAEGANFRDTVVQEDLRPRFGRACTEKPIELWALHDLRQRPSRLEGPALPTWRDEADALERVARKRTGKIEAVKGLDTDNAATIDRVSDLDVLFQNAHVKARFRQALTRRESSRPRSHDENVVERHSFSPLTSHLPRKVIQKESKMSFMSSQKLCFFT